MSAVRVDGVFVEGLDQHERAFRDPIAFGLTSQDIECISETLNDRENSVRLSISVLIGVVSLVATANAQTWNLFWSDEFVGSGINTSNWTYDIGGSGWGNSELEYYTARSAYVTVSNGNLLIIARKESYGGNDYTSARLKTQNLHLEGYEAYCIATRYRLIPGLW